MGQPYECTPFLYYSMHTKECIPSFSISTSRLGMKLKFILEIPNFKCQLPTSLAHVTGNHTIFADIRENLERRHQWTSSVKEKFFRMIEVKVCVQLKSGLDDRSVMIYRI